MRALAVLALALAAAPPAYAATVSGVQTDEYLEVTYAAAPGERNELRVLPHEVGVRFAGSRPLVAGDHCLAVAEGDVRCGPPGPVGLVVRVQTGDRDDVVFARVAHVALERIALGRGDDLGRGNGLMVGGPGEDDLGVVRGAALFRGGPAEDVLVGGRFRDDLNGGPGPDLLVGGRRFDELDGGAGRDQIAGGRGPDAVFADAGDDMIRAADGDHDLIRCGPGTDRATSIAATRRPAASASSWGGRADRVRFPAHVAPGRPATSPSPPPSGGITRGGRQPQAHRGIR